MNVITSSDKTIFDNVLNSFVGIAAIQIGITDILTALGLRPDKIIGKIDKYVYVLVEDDHYYSSSSPSTDSVPSFNSFI